MSAGTRQGSAFDGVAVASAGRGDFGRALATPAPAGGAVAGLGGASVPAGPGAAPGGIVALPGGVVAGVAASAGVVAAAAPAGAAVAGLGGASVPAGSGAAPGGIVALPGGVAAGVAASAGVAAAPAGAAVAGLGGANAPARPSAGVVGAALSLPAVLHGEAAGDGGSHRRPGRRDSLRVVVIGGGITGLLTSIQCVLAGHRVVLLERGPVPHPGATSFDQHRALRALVVGDRDATRTAAELHRRWRELDMLLCDHLPGAGLYRRVGVLQALPPGLVPAAVATASAAGVPLRIVHSAAYPLIGFPRGSGAVFEPHAGTLLADRVLHAAARWLRHHPDAELRPGREAVAVDADRAKVRLADGTTATGDVVLVAAGPWTAALVDRPVALHRQTMVYLRPPAALAHAWAATPTAGGIGADGRAWLLPSVAGTLLKVSTDAVRREVTTLSGPDDDKGWASRVLSAGIVSDVDGYDVVRVKHCHYATAEGGDTGFVRVGPAAWARPASGPDGFRTAPLAADGVVAELAAKPSFS